MTQRLTPSPSSDASGRPMNLKDGDLENPVPLPDFMQELGVLLQLPKRRTTRPIAIIPETTVQPARRSLRSVALAVLAVSIAAMAGYARFAPPPRAESLPQDLVGEWRTSNPKYRERILSFTGDRVGLSLGEGRTPALHPIVSWSSRAIGDTMVVAMTYEDDDQPVDFRVSLVKGGRLMLWLSNPPDVVWEPAGKGGAVAPAATKAAPVPAAANGPIATSAAGASHAWDH